jgi:hypothetical protein
LDQIHELELKRKNTSKANSKSEKLVNERRRAKINEIFDKLDEDKDN